MAIKTDYFTSFEAFEESNTVGEYERTTVIEYDNKICADLMTDTKSLKVAINRFFKSISNIELLYGFKEGFEEELKENGFISNYDGVTDRKNGIWAYSWEFQDNDGSFYIMLNVAK